MTTRDHLSVSSDDLKPSDAEREAIVRDLTKHCGDGRLTLEELEERVAEVYAAVTRAELDHSMRELPRAPAVIPPSKPPIRTTPSAAPVRQSVKKGAEVALRVHFAVYLSVISFLVLIYVLTSFGGHFWPVWPAAGWGLALAIQAGVTKAVSDD
jgi:hypothetical protein